MLKQTLFIIGISAGAYDLQAATFAEKSEELFKLLSSAPTPISNSSSTELTLSAVHESLHISVYRVLSHELEYSYHLETSKHHRLHGIASSIAMQIAIIDPVLAGHIKQYGANGRVLDILNTRMTNPDDRFYLQSLMK